MRLWIDALRSDKFEQGTGRLKLDGRYCCLGVLAKLYADTHQEKTIDWIINEECLVTLDNETGYCSDINIPCDVSDWCGLDYIDDTSKLVDMNDTEQKSFKEIADYLEKKYS